MSETLNKLASIDKYHAGLSSTRAFMPCCGLASLAYVTRTPLPIMYMHYRAKFDMPKQWRGSTELWRLKELAREYQLTIADNGRQNCELLTFCENNPSFFGMVRTTRHIQVVLGRAIFDQGGIKDIAEHWGRNKYVLNAIEVSDRPELSLEYRYLMLVTSGAANNFNHAKELYKSYSVS